MPLAGPAARVLHCGAGADPVATTTPPPRILRNSGQQLNTGILKQSQGTGEGEAWVTSCNSSPLT